MGECARVLHGGGVKDSIARRGDASSGLNVELRAARAIRYA